MKVASIDIGSNTFLLLVAEDDLSRVYLDEERFVGLGEGVSTSGRFLEKSLEKARSVLEEYRDICESLGVKKIYPFATEAARRAKNLEELEKLVKEIIGSPLDVISPEEEAILSFYSVLPDVEDGKAVSVDIGGGSTEVVFGGKEVEFLKSFPIGSVALTKRFVREDPPSREELARVQREIKRELSSLKPFPGRLFGLGGTITTLSMLNLGLKEFIRERIHMSRMSKKELEALISRINSLDRSGRLSMGIPEGRVDYLGIGGLILLGVMDATGANEVFVSTKGVRYGYLMKAFGLLPG